MNDVKNPAESWKDCERLFSMYSNIKNKTRNRMLTMTLNKRGISNDFFRNKKAPFEEDIFQTAQPQA